MRSHLHPGPRRPWPRLWAAGLALLLAGPAAQAATPDELLAAYVAQAKAPASAQRGQTLFTTNFGRELGFSCASCHGDVPVKAGRDQISEQPIRALAPAVNPQVFTDKAKSDTWFRQNCKDVVGRDCTAGEKADVLAWLLTLKP